MCVAARDRGKITNPPFCRFNVVNRHVTRVTVTISERLKIFKPYFMRIFGVQVQAKLQSSIPLFFMKLWHFMRVHPETFSFSQHIYRKTNNCYLSTDRWLNLKCTNCWDITATKQLRVLNKIFFFEKLISDVQNVYHRPKHISIQTICESLQQVFPYLLQHNF